MLLYSAKLTTIQCYRLFFLTVDIYSILDYTCKCVRVSAEMLCHPSPTTPLSKVSAQPRVYIKPYSIQRLLPMIAQSTMVARAWRLIFTSILVQLHHHQTGEME